MYFLDNNFIIIIIIIPFILVLDQKTSAKKILYVHVVGILFAHIPIASCKKSYCAKKKKKKIVNFFGNF